MSNRNPLDPDDPASASVEARIAAALEPVAPGADRAAALRSHLLARARASRAADAHVRRVRRDDGTWRDLATGVRVKVLHENDGARSVLLELAAGAALPAHRHREHEECVVLRGEAQLGDLEVRQGDFHVAPAGSRHRRVSSRAGALLFLRGVPIGDALGVARGLVGAWLPGDGASPRTVRADDDWTGWHPGVDAKSLWDDGAAHSLLVRMAPGAHLPGAALDADEECLLVDGEVFSDDALLRAGDFELVRRGAPARTFATDTGALLYLRGTRAGPARHA